MSFNQMELKLNGWPGYLVTALLYGSAFSSMAVELSVKPERCIALNQGQTCYQRVVLQWQAEQNHSLCLRLVGARSSIKCWQESKEGIAEFDVQSATDQGFELVDQQGEVVASTQVEVAWVYKSSKRHSSWRLF